MVVVRGNFFGDIIMSFSGKKNVGESSSASDFIPLALESILDAWIPPPRPVALCYECLC